MDRRNLPVSELVDLYKSAHCFVLPSYGEGWGLTLSDALATGLPSIWTACSAMLDYADETTGFPITKFRIVPVCTDGVRICRGAEPDQGQFIQLMTKVYSDYPAALERSKAASERMHGQYTWALSAQRLIEICERYA